MLARRVIPCLDVKDGRVVKGVQFVDLRDAGDPVEAARAYDGQGADELVFLDITASHEDRAIMLDVVRRTAAGVYMPLTVGGGIRTVEDVRRLLRAGADKVSFNTAAVARPAVIEEAARHSEELAPVAAQSAFVGRKLRVLCLAHEESDRLCQLMLRSALDPRAFEVDVCSPDLLVSEAVELVGRKRADVVCVGSMPPRGLRSAKLLCRRMRKRFPDADILVARWGGRDPSEAEDLRAAGASGVYAGIDELRLALIAACSAHQAGGADVHARGDTVTPVAAGS